MSRRRILVGFAMLAVFAGLVLLAVATLRGREDVGEREYVRRNLRLLAELPVFPGARRLWKPISDDYTSRDSPDAPVAGYYTSQSFALRAATNRARVTRYFVTHMSGWRREDATNARFAVSFRRGEQFVRLLVYTPREYVLSIDHRCRGCPGP